MRIHGEKLTEQLKPLHERLSSCFRELKEKVEKLYGVITLVSFVQTALTLSPMSYNVTQGFRCQMGQAGESLFCLQSP